MRNDYIALSIENDSFGKLYLRNALKVSVNVNIVTSVHTFSSGCFEYVYATRYSRATFNLRHYIHFHHFLTVSSIFSNISVTAPRFYVSNFVTTIYFSVPNIIFNYILSLILLISSTYFIGIQISLIFASIRFFLPNRRLS